VRPDFYRFCQTGIFFFSDLFKKIACDDKHRRFSVPGFQGDFFYFRIGFNLAGHDQEN